MENAAHYSPPRLQISWIYYCITKRFLCGRRSTSIDYWLSVGACSADPSDEHVPLPEFYKTIFSWNFSSPPCALEGAYYVMFSKSGTKLVGGMQLVEDGELIQPKISSEGERAGYEQTSYDLCWGCIKKDQRCGRHNYLVCALRQYWWAVWLTHRTSWKLEDEYWPRYGLRWDIPRHGGQWCMVHEVGSNLNLCCINSCRCNMFYSSPLLFSASKVTANGDPLLSFEWCKSPEIGLPASDLVLFLDITPEKAKEHGGYGEERYEKDEMQKRVRKFFHRIGGEEMVSGDKDFSARWVTVNAGRDRDAVAKDIWMLDENLVTKGVKGPIQKLWSTENWHVPWYSTCELLLLIYWILN